MTPAKFATLWPLLAIAVIAVACSSTPPHHFYVLDAISAAGKQGSNLSVLVGPVTIPERINRPEFVLSRNDGEVMFDENHRWASPLQDGLADAIAGDLAAQLGSQHVVTSRYEGEAIKYRVKIAVQQFRSRLADHALLEAHWFVRRDDGAIRLRRSNVREIVHGEDFAALVAAHSRAVSRMSGEIAEAIRDLEDGH